MSKRRSAPRARANSMPVALSFPNGAHQVSYPDYIEAMTEEQQAVMQAPFVRRR